MSWEFCEWTFVLFFTESNKVLYSKSQIRIEIGMNFQKNQLKTFGHHKNESNW